VGKPPEGMAIAPFLALRRKGVTMTILWIIIVALFVLWILGAFVFKMAGWLIHLLLIVAVILLIVNLVRRASSAV
jgi:hypothetical protein